MDVNQKTQRYDITFTCSEKYDDRGDWAISHIKKISNNVVDVSYCHEKVVLTIDGVTINVRDLLDYNLPAGKFLIDSTSLALPELLHLFTIFEHNKKGFDVIYVQPGEYTESKNKGLDKVKSFDLSDDGLGPQQIPPYIGYTTNSSIFIFLGFEGHRFGSLINSDEYDIRNVSCLLGVPGLPSFY